MNQLQHTARIAALAMAPTAALVGWLWFQPSYSATVFGAPSSGGVPPQCVQNPQSPDCVGVRGTTDEASADDENHEIPLVPAAIAYPAFAALSYSAARAIRRRRA
jgi:hypothetical protein